MDEDKIKSLFEDKYERLLGMSYEEWLEEAPQNEAEAYGALEALDEEIKLLLEARDAAAGAAKEDIADQLDFLRTQYTLIEDMYGLEAQDS